MYERHRLVPGMRLNHRYPAREEIFPDNEYESQTGWTSLVEARAVARWRTGSENNSKMYELWLLEFVPGERNSRRPECHHLQH